MDMEKMRLNWARDWLKLADGEPEAHAEAQAVRHQPLKETANLLSAVLTSGTSTASERALRDSHQYRPSDLQRQWNFKLDEAIARGRKQGALTSLLAGTNVYFAHGTKSLQTDNFQDSKTVATYLGAHAVKNGLPNVREE